MAVWIQAVSRVVAPGSPGQRGQLGRSGRQCPGVIHRRIIHHQVDLGPRDALGPGRIGQGRTQQGPDTGFWHEAKHDPITHGEFRHPGHIQGWLAAQHGLPEGGRGTLIADVKDDMHRADHLNDDSGASLDRAAAGLPGTTPGSPPGAPATQSRLTMTVRHWPRHAPETAAHQRPLGIPTEAILAGKRDVEAAGKENTMTIICAITRDKGQHRKDAS
jgi:hypothetical protein